MFDPTIFDNIKVVIQGAVYDLDLNGSIHVVDRRDCMEMARMGREFSMMFREQFGGEAIATISLFADLWDLSTEILEFEREDIPRAGCRLEIKLAHETTKAAEHIAFFDGVLNRIWGQRPRIEHQIFENWELEEKGPIQKNSKYVVTLDFNRKIDENQLSDIPELLQLVLESLEEMNQLLSNT